MWKAYRPCSKVLLHSTHTCTMHLAAIVLSRVPTPTGPTDTTDLRPAPALGGTNSSRSAGEMLQLKRTHRSLVPRLERRHESSRLSIANGHAIVSGSNDWRARIALEPYDERTYFRAPMMLIPRNSRGVSPSGRKSVGDRGVKIRVSHPCRITINLSFLRTYR